MTMSVKVKRPKGMRFPDRTAEHEVLTASEAAVFLRVSKPCIYSLANDAGAGFPACKVGNKLRISRRALLSWLEQARNGRNDEAKALATS
jgi:excisionase family DNA binding protein